MASKKSTSKKTDPATGDKVKIVALTGFDGPEGAFTADQEGEVTAAYADHLVDTLKLAKRA